MKYLCTHQKGVVKLLRLLACRQTIDKQFHILGMMGNVSSRTGIARMENIVYYLNLRTPCNQEDNFTGGKYPRPGKGNAALSVRGVITHLIRERR